MAVARPHCLCVAAANTLHILSVRADNLSDTEEEPEHSRAPVVFEFSEFTVIVSHRHLVSARSSIERTTVFLHILKY